MTEPIDDRLILLPELAKRWGLTMYLARKLLREGLLPPHVQVGKQARFSLSVIERFEDGGLLTKQQLAERWGFSVRTIEQREKAGKLAGKVMLGPVVRYRLNPILAIEAAETRG